MKELVHYNAGQLAPLSLQLPVQNHFPFSNERSRVNRLTMRTLGIKLAA